MTIIVFLFTTAFILPSVVSEFGDSSSSIDTDITATTNDNGFSLIQSLFSVFVWDIYGALPEWLNLTLKLVEIAGIIILVKILRGVPT
jgi:hypothetical protein